MSTSRFALLTRNLLAFGFGAALFVSSGLQAKAQGGVLPRLQSEQQAGWVEDMAGMRHFSGLRCPDAVGPLSRSKVLSANTQQVAGCIYLGRDGVNAVLRQHLKGSGKNAARLFKENFAKAGFAEVKLTGVSASGISFMTREWKNTTDIETLWQLQGEKADYTLWLYYVLPKHETDIGITLRAFEEILARQN